MDQAEAAEDPVLKTSLVGETATSTEQQHLANDGGAGVDLLADRPAAESGSLRMQQHLQNSASDTSTVAEAVKTNNAGRRSDSAAFAPSTAEAACASEAAACAPAQPASPAAAAACSAQPASGAAGDVGGFEKSEAAVKELVLSPLLHGWNCMRGELLLRETERLQVELFLAAAVDAAAQEKEKQGSDSDARMPLTRWRLLPEVLPVETGGLSKRGRLKHMGSGAASFAQSRSSMSSLSGWGKSSGSNSYDRRFDLFSGESIAMNRPQRVSRPASFSVAGGSLSSASLSTAGAGSQEQQHQEELEEEDGQGQRQQPQQQWPPAPWVCAMHEVLVELCKQPVCLPFFPRVSPADSHYAELARKVFPAVPITLETVLDKLERNEYARCDEVFNDVYSVFLCAFRYYEPGNQYWLMAQEASIVFEDLVKQQQAREAASFRSAATSAICSTGSGATALTPQPLLVNDFDAAINLFTNTSDFNEAEAESGSSDAQYDAVGADRAAAGDRKRRGAGAASAPAMDDCGRTTNRKKSRSDRESFDSAVGPSASYKDSEREESPISASSPNAPAAARAATAAGATASAGVLTLEERETFQQLLLNLDMESHLQLYNTFKDRAQWVTFDSGEVELDDANTAPEVFREMVVWCQDQVAEQQHVEVHNQPEGVDAAPQGDSTISTNVQNASTSPRTSTEAALSTENEACAASTEHLAVSETAGDSASAATQEDGVSPAQDMGKPSEGSDSSGSDDCD